MQKVFLRVFHGFVAPWVPISIGIAVLAACHSGSKAAPDRTRLCSVYYWSTTYDTGSGLAAHLVADADRLYLRYFDVVDEEGVPLPNATINFRSPIPDTLEVVPVVFIVNDVMRLDNRLPAGKLLQRIVQISEAHNVKRVNEVQIDCDWTTSTRNAYFQFLTDMRREAHARGLRLSVTIRLHQLSQSPPPADRGVLMLYNTGDFTDMAQRHPILSMADVVPYLRHLPRYDLPLAAAYPLFSYRILFRQGSYVGIAHRDNRLLRLPGDTLVERKTTATEVAEVARTIDAIRPDIHQEVIVYEVSNNHSNQYTISDYEKIYHFDSPAVQ